MRPLILLFLATFFHSSIIAQPLYYKGERVDSISILSNRNHYCFDERGTTKGKSDEYVIAYSKAHNSYRILYYTKIKYKSFISPKSLSINKRELPLKRYCNNAMLSDLINSIDTYYVKPTFSNVGIIIPEFKKLTNEKFILKMMTKLQPYKTPKIDLVESQVSDCQNIDTFNLFLSISFDTSIITKVTDYTDEFRISIKTEKRMYWYIAPYPNIYKQPWRGSNSVLNLSINSILIDFLPKHFYRLKTLYPSALINSYLDWVLTGKHIPTYRIE